MKSRLFPPGRVALVVNSLLFTPPASCQAKKSIDFIWHVMTWDWYEIPGKPCVTGNEPIRDSAGEVVGFHYVGYSKVKWIHAVPMDGMFFIREKRSFDFLEQVAWLDSAAICTACQTRATS